MLQVLQYQLMQRVTKIVTLRFHLVLTWLFAWQVSSCSSTTTKPDTKERLTTRAGMKTSTPATPLVAKSPAIARKTSSIPTSTCKTKSKPWKEGRMGWRQTGGPTQIMVSKSNWKYQKWSLFVRLFQVNTFICPDIFIMECKSLFVHSFIFFHISYQNLQGNN